MKGEKKMPKLVEVLPLGGFDHPLTYGLNYPCIRACRLVLWFVSPWGQTNYWVVSSLEPEHRPPREKLRLFLP